MTPDQADERYAELGVRSDKSGVVSNLPFNPQELVPSAFAVVLMDHLGGDEDAVLALHSDGVGTKSLFAYLLDVCHEDSSRYKHLAQDALAMNLDDLACAGFLGPFVVSNVINRNLSRISDSVCAEIVSGYGTVAEALANWSVAIVSAGGETADVGDIVRTLTIDATVASSCRREDVVDAGQIGPSQEIVGLSSVGTASWETETNSGVMSNGMTLLRHYLLSADYAEVDESYDLYRSSVGYRGEFALTDRLPGTTQSVGHALTSPSRIYTPIIASVLGQFRKSVKGIVHVTGGGLTKSMNYGRVCRQTKDSLFDLPPIMRQLLVGTDLSFGDMASVLNCGHGLEIYVEDGLAKEVSEFIDELGCGVSARRIGFTSESDVMTALVEALDGQRASFEMSTDGRIVNS